MKARLRSFSSGSAQGLSFGLALVLLVLVLVSSVCLLWFVNQAALNERLAARQKRIESYRGHLALAQQRLDAYWRQTAADLDAQAQTLAPGSLFARQVRAGLADAVICFDAAGHVAYPGPNLPIAELARRPAGTGPAPLPAVAAAAFHLLSSAPVPAAAADTPAPDFDSMGPAEAAEAFARLAEHEENLQARARALQAQARGLVQAGKTEAALAVLTGPLSEERFAQVTDAQGRLLAPNAQLLALELTSAAGALRALTWERLRKATLDYDNSAMSAPQRHFLLRQLQRLHPDAETRTLLAAEDLAAQYVETGPLQFGEPGLRATSMAGVWQFASGHGRVLVLHRTEGLLARVRTGPVAQLLSPDLNLILLPPGEEAEGFFPSLPASPLLPGWRLTLALKDQRLFDTEAEHRVAAYVWTGALVVGAVVVLASLALGLVRRQTALTQLRNDLVANITHELKTPLASMRLLVDTLLNGETLHAPTVREYLQMIAQENLRLSRLIDNFLAFSRMERNKYAFDFKELPAAAIVEAAAGAVRERFQGPGCRFEVAPAPELPPVLADADALVTALVNLLDNACKYSGDDKRITLAADAGNGSVRFAVTDNGIGLAPRDTRRISKRFFRVAQGPARASGGCGLGLSIVEFIVKAHLGSVRVESQLGRGSTFIIAIPAANARPNPALDVHSG